MPKNANRFLATASPLLGQASDEEEMGCGGGENRRKNKSWIAERIEGKREKERSKYHHHPLCFHLAFGTCWHLSTTSF